MKIAANTQESQARVERLLPQTTPAVAEVLERAMAGQELSRQDGVILAHTTGNDVEALIAVADHVRREVVGRRVLDADQVADGVRILGPVQAAEGDAAGVRYGGAVRFE